MRLGRDRSTGFDRQLTNPGPPATDQSPQTPLARVILTGCLVLLVFTGFIMASVRLLGSEIARAGHSTDTTTRQIVMGNEVLRVPANIIRFRSQRRATTTERLDIYLLWPKMEGYSEQSKAQFNQTSVNPQMLFVTVEPRLMTLDMSGRIEPIYSKFLLGIPVTAGHGLLKQGLDVQGGFIGEELWFEADSPYPFAARCTLAGAGSATPYCLRDIHAGRDLMVTYRFHQSLIGEWMDIDAAVRAQMKRMLVN